MAFMGHHLDEPSGGTVSQKTSSYGIVLVMPV